MKLKLLLTSLAVALPLTSFAASSNAASAPLNASAPTTNQKHASCTPGNPETSAYYAATKWYRDSAEGRSQYNQVDSMGLAQGGAQGKCGMV